jgi:hypothetical protein
MEVDIALIAHPTDPFRNVAPEEEWARPYADRRKVRLEVTEEESLASVLERAAAAMGLSPPEDHRGSQFSAAHRNVAFYKPEDDDGFADRPIPRYLMSQLTLVDDQRRAMFGVHDHRVVRYSDLLRAQEAGTLDGDPQRPYLIVEPGYGDVPPPDWPTVVEGLKVLWDVIERLAAIGGAWFFGKKVIEEAQKRLGRGVEAAEAHPEWAQRDTRPYQFAVLFFTRPWQAGELAGLLGCSTPEAEGILWALGFALDEERALWQYSGDDAAELINAVHREIQIASHRGGSDWISVLRRRLIHLLETGESPRWSSRRTRASGNTVRALASASARRSITPSGASGVTESTRLSPRLPGPGPRSRLAIASRRKR